jgi:hypothetical protein
MADVELTFMQDLPAHADPEDMDLLLVNTNGDDKSITLKKVSDYVGSNVGKVKTVNSQSPDEEGNISLSAANIGAIPTTGGTVTGEIKSTALNNFRITAGNRSFFLRYDGNDFDVMKTNAGDPDGIWDNDRPLRINNDGSVYIEGARPKTTYITEVKLSARVGIGGLNGIADWTSKIPSGAVLISALTAGDNRITNAVYSYVMYKINGVWTNVTSD